MPQAASDRPPAVVDFADAPASGQDANGPRPSLRQLLVPMRGPGERGPVVQILPAPEADEEPIPFDANWPAAIEMIRDVGARMRQARRYAQDVVQHWQGVVESTVQRLEETERRLRQSETAAQDALSRAERAEDAARIADARARRAEEEAEAARLKLAEAQVWLRRLYSSVQVEFREMTDEGR